MKICRFNDDRLGFVVEGFVHDVTDLQTEIRSASPYAMLGEEVIAALPEWRECLSARARQVPGVPLAEVALLAPVARPSKVMAAPTNYSDHIAEMAAARVAGGSELTPKSGTDGIVRT